MQDPILQEVKDVLKANCDLLERSIEELKGNSILSEHLKTEIEFLKDLLSQLSNIVKDDADNSLIIRVSKLEGLVGSLLLNTDKNKVNSRAAIIVALITAITTVIIRIVEGIFITK